jgi:hypothetical protein
VALVAQPGEPTQGLAALGRAACGRMAPGQDARGLRADATRATGARAVIYYASPREIELALIGARIVAGNDRPYDATVAALQLGQAAEIVGCRLIGGTYRPPSPLPGHGDGGWDCEIAAGRVNIKHLSRSSSRRLAVQPNDRAAFYVVMRPASGWGFECLGWISTAEIIERGLTFNFDDGDGPKPCWWGSQLYPLPIA